MYAQSLHFYKYVNWLCINDYIALLIFIFTLHMQIQFIFIPPPQKSSISGYYTIPQYINFRFNFHVFTSIFQIHVSINSEKSTHRGKLN